MKNHVRIIISVLRAVLLTGILTTLSLTTAVAAAPTPPNIVTASLPDGAVNVPYATPLTAGGGSNIFASWSIISGAAPDGLAIINTNGIIDGTPTKAGTFTFTVQVYDSTSTTATKSMTITITAGTNAVPLKVTTSSLASGKVGAAYSQALAASGGSGTYSAWSVTSGALPGGLALLASTGIISGTPTTAGTFAFTVQVADSAGAVAIQPLTIVITAAATTPPSITTASLPSGKVNVIYSQTLAASGGTGTYTWFLTSGILPAGLSLATSTGIIGGTPTSAGTYTFTAQVTDSSGATATQSLTIVIAAATPAPPSIIVTSLPNGKVGTPYAVPLTATGGSNVFASWSIISGALPDGLAIINTNGIINGTPTKAGTFTFTVQVYDSTSTIGTGIFTITIVIT